MNELKRIYRENPFQTISLAFSFCAAIISLIVASAVWQSTINKRVDAIEIDANLQQTILHSIDEKLDDINSRGMVNSQRIVDTNDKVGLIYELIKVK